MAQLEEYGEIKYDNIIMMCNFESLKSKIKPKNLMAFFDGENNNLMVFADVDASNNLRSVANSLGIYMDTKVLYCIFTYIRYHEALMVCT